jgi:hypothetical protein
VDTTSLNQEDLVERLHQVSWIGSIYEASQETGTCAGADSEGDKDYIADFAKPKSAPFYDMTLGSQRPYLPWEDRVVDLLTAPTGLGCQLWKR